MSPSSSTNGISNPLTQMPADWLARDVLTVMSRHLPPYVVVDAANRVVQFSGGFLAEYLDPGPGIASLDIFDLLNGTLHAALRGVLEEVARTGGKATRHETMVRAGEAAQRLRISAERLAHGVDADDGAVAAQGTELIVIVFDGGPGPSNTVQRSGHAAAPTPPHAGSQHPEHIDSLTEELMRRLDHQAIVEELRSTNEELEAAREEMQTVNAELGSKNRSLISLNNDFRNLLDSTQIATLFLDADLQVRNFTPNMAELFALRRSDIGRPLTDLRARLDYTALIADVRQILKEGGVVEREVRSLDEDGRVFLMRMHPYQRADAAAGGVVLTFIDITERKRTDDRVWFLAHHDELTGLANRVVFHATLERDANAPAGADRLASLLYLDLDRFKSVNDAFGHRVGDELLRLVAARLRRCVRPGDVICRLGGDEFAVIQRMTGQTGEATALAERIIAAVGLPYEINGHTLRIGVSVGIALRGSGTADVETLARSADVALYAAKARGRGTYEIFDPKVQLRYQERRSLEVDLGEALARDEFIIVYQPLVCLSDGRIMGAEALIRWHHPSQGLLSPAAFIPIAEETGLITAIGSWVLQTACMQAVGWPGSRQLSVNLSSVQFESPDLPDVVREALERSGLPADRLVLELTESVLLRDEERTQDRLRAFRRMGVKIALDDFGTGYSSLSYLHTFAVDKIKIDRTFTQTLGNRKESTLIVQAVVAIARGLEVAVCAEGVETDGQLTALRKLGVQEVQGFCLYKPVAPAELAVMLQTSAPS